MAYHYDPTNPANTYRLEKMMTLPNDLSGAKAMRGAYADMNRRYMQLLSLAKGTTDATCTDAEREDYEARAQAISEEWLLDDDSTPTIDDTDLYI